MANEPLLISDINTGTRDNIGEPSATGRWDNPTLNRNIWRAMSWVTGQVKWPEATLTAQSITNQVEYTLPAFTQILRVYLAGQRITPTSIPILEGDQIELYDQTAPGFLPQWKAQAPATYPVNSSTGYPQLLVPWQRGFRPRFYLRTGNIGFVPAPAGSYLIQVDCIPAPPQIVDLTNGTDQTYFPARFLDCLCFKTAELCLRADKNHDSANSWLTQAVNAAAELRDWVSGIVKDMPKPPIWPQYRAGYASNTMNRANTSWSDE